MKIKTPADELIVLPAEIKDKLKTATLPELKVILYLYAEKEADAAALSSALGITPGEAEAAMAFWRGAGLLTEDDAASKKKVPSESPYRNYDSYTIAEKLKEERFRLCTEIASEKLGKQLTKPELNSLVYLYDYVNLPPEMISGVVEYCVSKGKCSMNYIFRTAVSMYEKDGIDTYEKFEKYLAHLEKVGSDVEKVRRLCGFGDRELTTKESTFLERWFGEWELSYDLVHLSYEKTVDALGKVQFSYMNAMLKRWYEEGCLTPEDVSKKDVKPEKDGSVAGYGDSDAFFEAALKKGLEEV